MPPPRAALVDETGTGSTAEPVLQKPLTSGDCIRALRHAADAIERLQQAELVSVIAATVGPGVAFSARELWQHRVVSPALASAFAEAGIRSPRQLGKRLRQMPTGIVRLGEDRAGVLWTVD